jgi:hypothetical protein
MSETIEITLSSTLAERFIMLIDVIDADLVQIKWHPLIKKKNCYASRRYVIDGKPVTRLLHRIILERILGRALGKGDCVDHIDGNGLNNTRSNLRLATFAQNSRNRRTYGNNKSGYKGVSRNKANNLWVAQIAFEGVAIWLGEFTSKIEAAKQYNIAALKYHGEFAWLNPLPENEDAS